MQPPQDLVQQFGQIDIYLFDQILKGRFRPGCRVLDAGCGGGRNLVWFMRQGYDVSAVDASPHAVDQVRRMASSLAPKLPAGNFRVEAVEALSFAQEFEAVLSSAVLHFADDETHFRAMLDAMWRVLRPGGFLFVRLASSIGIEDRAQALGGGRYHLPDGSDRFLVDEAMLLQLTDALGGRLAEPIKTTNVQGLRAMTTWCVERSGQIPPGKTSGPRQGK